ncbi:hypothetical protein SAMN02745244_03686 [Tessaracoccus bendigoensis DSM 12906]|uniref:Sodium:proton antiporter n=1 Tax=Tessaracoccus bendigoensis DSM 12906 TaxID=1123357 RepID=A0A1M6NPH3_9ACTN|nr:DUF6328 family protein [Tessaracoccus bendigoensis]SHJ97619.1 hypothetical protein SAMN02745244_03686 [Tessaracoccus bendigoensis DSM 12906]
MTDEGAQYRDEELPYKRIDRHWAELLQELRVTQAGVQILAGLLYTVPFQPGFAALDGWQRAVYLVAVSLATLAAALLIAPVAFHRAMYRRRLRPELIDVSSRSAKLGLAMLALSLVAVVTLVFSVVLAPVAGLVAGGVSLLGFAFLWLWLPARLAHGAPMFDED